MAKVGRFKVNKKLGLDQELSQSILTISDIVATLRYLVALHRGDLTMDYGREVRVEKDDIDHFGNRRPAPILMFIFSPLLDCYPILN